MEVWLDHIIQALTQVAVVTLGISWYRFYVKGQSGWQAFKSACKQVWPAAIFMGLGLLSVLGLILYLFTKQ